MAFSCHYFSLFFIDWPLSWNSLEVASLHNDIRRSLYRPSPEFTLNKKTFIMLAMSSDDGVEKGSCLLSTPLRSRPQTVLCRFPSTDAA